MKYIKTLPSAAALAALSSQATFAEPVVLSSDLKLVGFSGGSCNISVNASPNATNLDLDEQYSPAVDVGTVNTACDYDYRVTVETTKDVNGNQALIHRNGIDTVHFDLWVDATHFWEGSPTSEVGSFLAGDNRQMPVEVATLHSAPVPGIYQGTVTFSLIID